MGKPTVVVGPQKKKEKWPPGPNAVRRGVGSAVGWTGLAFLLVGGFDFLLTWYPMDFGNREWEFGTVTASLNGLPVPTMGLALLLAGALLLERRWWAGVVGLAAFGACLWVLAAGVLWLTNVPLALETVPAEVETGLKKALVKSALQGVIYPPILAFLGWRAVGTIRGTIGSRRQ